MQSLENFFSSFSTLYAQEILNPIVVKEILDQIYISGLLFYKFCHLALIPRDQLQKG